MQFTTTALLGLCAIGANAAFPGSRMHLPNPPMLSTAPLPSRNSTFMQTIDHSNPSSGKFSQFYYWDDTYYQGPGAPVILMTPGEINVTGYNTYLTTERITGLFAKAIGAGIVVIEHRYWGMSSPYSVLSTENMQQLTLKNSIADLVNFAKNAKLPFDPDGTSKPNKAPWVLAGGSYSGALSAWTESTSPGTFWVYTASSAPVQAISDYWQYFHPVQEGMPKNCSKDVSLVIDHIDEVLESGNQKAITALKTMFGLENLEHNDDFASALENGPWLWQGNQFYENEGFYQFCDGVEGVTSTSKTLPGPNGVGLTKALAGYANWFKNTLLPGYCQGYGYFHAANSVQCFATYNKNNPVFTDMTLSNTVDRQWTWMLCNEPFGYWQDGAPSTTPTITSRLVNATYWTRQCALYFPTGPNGETYGIAKGKTEAQLNAWTKGWNNNNSTRLMFTNGQFDPWRESGVSSDYRPGGPLKPTTSEPINIVPGGFHCSDLLAQNGLVNPGVQAVINTEIAQVKKWVSEFVPTYE